MVLLIVACIYLFLHIRQYLADTTSADGQQSRLVQLEGRKPGPTEENVRLVSSNSVVFESYLKKIAEVLQRGQVEPRKMQPVDFNSFLKSTIDYMNDAAKKQGLVLPAKFDFGFKTYYSEGHLPAVGDVPRLTVQVQLVRALMDVLRKSRVAEVSSVERQVFEKGAVAVAEEAESESRGRSRGVAPGVTTLYPLEPSESQGLYTREHFVLTLRVRDEFIAGLLNALAGSSEAGPVRLFTVVTHVDISGAGLPKSGVAGAATAVAPAEGVAVAGAEPKKREERIVAGAENTTVQLGVDIYRFAGETGEKAKL
ncbi:MAG: hypothetical protein EPN23_05135 [Verrucomicrobia bacterium]|nr:MAG: hypothetical protein EPN23_05135 [Verrucomicrobiota bacterium]